MQEKGLQRIRFAMRPDEAFGLIYSWDNVIVSPARRPLHGSPAQHWHPCRSFPPVHFVCPRGFPFRAKAGFCPPSCDCDTHTTIVLPSLPYPLWSQADTRTVRLQSWESLAAEAGEEHTRASQERWTAGDAWDLLEDMGNTDRGTPCGEVDRELGRLPTMQSACSHPLEQAWFRCMCREATAELARYPAHAYRHVP